MDANICRNPTDDQILDALDIEHEFEVSMLEGTSARLINNLLVIDREELGDNFVAYFATDQEAPKGTFVANSETGGVVLAAGKFSS